MLGVSLQLLGLLLPKYVPEEAPLRQPSWAGVLQHEDTLVAMLQQHVIEPLLNGEHSETRRGAVLAAWRHLPGHSPPLRASIGALCNLCLLRLHVAYSPTHTAALRASPLPVPATTWPPH